MYKETNSKQEDIQYQNHSKQKYLGWSHTILSIFFFCFLNKDILFRKNVLITKKKSGTS